jgi:3-deoxy-7-phosphoheptulonate synthase
MMLKIVNEIDLPIADEILYPDLALPYLSDLYSYGCIGARSSEHQRKRMIASGTDFPTGIKNPTSGDLTKAVQSVKVAQAPHAPFPHVGNIVTTQGNSHVHLVLRGGSGRPNYYPHALNLATQLLKEQNIKNPSIVVDLSHENSIGTDGEKDYLRQIPVGESVLRYRQSHPQNNIRGIMVESFLQAGKQTIPPSSQSIIPGKSLTDACLGWEDTQSFLQKITSFLS